MLELDRSISPELTTFKDLRLDFPNYITLSNGIKLYVVNSGDQEVNRLEVLYRGGLFDEDKPLQSFALASMLIHGTKQHTSKNVAEILDYNGSYVNATSHENYTHISCTSLNRNFISVLPLLKDILAEPSIPEREFEVLKSQVKSAYQNARERVKYLSQMEARKLYFGDCHPLSHIIVDEDVDNLSSDDVRRFHSRFYKPENCTLVLSGKIDDKELNLVESIFGKDELINEVASISIANKMSGDERISVVNKDGALQSSIYMIHEAIPRSHPDYIKLRILVTALGGYFGSRLMQNIREDKGYTYGINAMLVGRRGGAKIVISSECDTAYTYSVIEETQKEIIKLQQELVEDWELEIVKNCMLSDLAKTLDSPFSMASCVTSDLLYCTGEDYFNRQVSEIMNIDARMLQDVANKYLNVNNFYIAIAGNEKQLKLYRI